MSNLGRPVENGGLTGGRQSPAIKYLLFNDLGWGPTSWITVRGPTTHNVNRALVAWHTRCYPI